MFRWRHGLSADTKQHITTCLYLPPPLPPLSLSVFPSLCLSLCLCLCLCLSLSLSWCEICPANRKDMGDWPPKQVGDVRWKLRLRTATDTPKHPAHTPRHAPDTHQTRSRHPRYAPYTPSHAPDTPKHPQTRPLILSHLQFLRSSDILSGDSFQSACSLVDTRCHTLRTLLVRSCTSRGCRELIYTRVRNSSQKGSPCVGAVYSQRTV